MTSDEVQRQLSDLYAQIDAEQRRHEEEISRLREEFNAIVHRDQSKIVDWTYCVVRQLDRLQRGV